MEAENDNESSTAEGSLMDLKSRVCAVGGKWDEFSYFWH